MEHLLKIRGFEKTYTRFLINNIKDDEIRPFIRDTLYPKPRDISLKNANDLLMTFAFIRNPFNRLVSAYNDKLKRNQWNKHTEWGFSEDVQRTRNIIIKKFRNVDPTKTNDNPSPKEFVTFILEQAQNNGSLVLNRHWRPQYALCPFCGMNFDFVGEIKEMNNHVKFLGNLLGIKVN